MVKLNLIVAIDVDGGISKDGRIPWNLKGDLKYFKATTIQTKSKNKKNAVVMGRKTWESIPKKFRPLYNRINIVITSNNNYLVPRGVLISKDLSETFYLLNNTQLKEQIESVFIIGGKKIFNEVLLNNFNLIDKLYITHILESFNCDNRINLRLSSEKISLVSKTPTINENSVDYYFAEYTIKQASNF